MALKDMALGLVITAKNKTKEGVDGARKGLTSLVEKLREVKNAEGAAGKFSALRNGIKSLTPSLSTIGSLLKGVAVGVTGLVASFGASVGTLTAFTRSQGQAAQQLTNTASALNISRQSLQAWQIAGERFGLSGEKVSDILKDVSEKIGDFANTGGGEGADIFEKLNLDVQDFINLSPDEQLNRLTQAISELDSNSQQIALLEGLASDASLLQPLLENNAAALKQITQEAQASGAILSEEDLDKLTKANQIYAEIDLKIKAFGKRVAAELAPALGDAATKLVELFNKSEAGDKLLNLFRSLTKNVVDFAEALLNNTDTIGNNVRAVANTFEFLLRAGQAAFYGIKTAATVLVTFIAATFANILNQVETLVGGLNKIGLASDEAYASISAKAEAANRSVRDLSLQIVENGNAAVEAGKKAFGAFDDTAKAADDTRVAMDRTTATIVNLAEELKTPAEAGQEALEQMERAAERTRLELDELGVGASEAFNGISGEAKEALDELDLIAEKLGQAGLEADKASEVLQEGFLNALENIDTPEGLEKLKEKLTKFREAGEIDSAEYTKALEAIRQKILQLNGLNLDIDLNGPEEQEGDGPEEQIDRVGDAATNAKPKVDSLADAIGNSSKEADEFKEKWEAAWGGAFGQALTNARTSVTSLSNAARNLFETSIGSNQFVNEAESARESLEKTRIEVAELQSASLRLRNNSFADWFNDVALQAARVRQRFYEQKLQLDDLTESVNAGQFSMEQLANLSDRAANRFDALDAQQLNGLQQAIDRARSKMESLNSSAESTLSSLRQRLADIQGDTEEAQRIQFEQERRRLQEQIKAAEEAGADAAAADYQKALDTLEKINKIEQQNRREEENAREKEAADRAREQQQAEQQRQQTDSLGDIRNNTRPVPEPERRPTQTIILQGPTGRDIEVETSDPDGFLSVLEDAGLRTP